MILFKCHSKIPCFILTLEKWKTCVNIHFIYFNSEYGWVSKESEIIVSLQVLVLSKIWEPKHCFQHHHSACTKESRIRASWIVSSIPQFCVELSVLDANFKLQNWDLSIEVWGKLYSRVFAASRAASCRCQETWPSGKYLMSLLLLLLNVHEALELLSLFVALRLTVEIVQRTPVSCSDYISSAWMRTLSRLLAETNTSASCSISILT